MKGEPFKPPKCCDNCAYYNWYYEFCSKWQTETNPFLVTDCWSDEVSDEVRE